MTGQTSEQRLQSPTNFYKPWVSSPAVDNTPLDLRVELSSLASSEELIQATSRRTTAVLRVLRERYGPFDAIGFHFACGFCSHWPDVSECDIRLVRGRLGMQLIKKAGHAFSLEPGVPKDRRTASNISVLLFDLWSTPLGNIGSKKALEWKRNEVSVKEEIFEKIVGFGDLA